jgi:hypothetical protein
MRYPDMALRAIEMGTGLNPEVLEGCGNNCRNNKNV